MFFWQVGCCNYTGFPRGNDCFGTSDPNSRCTRHFPTVSKLCKCILGYNVLSMNVDFFICFFTDQLKLYYRRTSHQEVASSVFLSENISSWWDLWSYSREKCPRWMKLHPSWWWFQVFQVWWAQTLLSFQAPSSRFRETFPHSFRSVQRHS